VTVPRGVITEPVMFVMQEWPEDMAQAATSQLSGRNLALPDNPVSETVTVETMGGNQQGSFSVSLSVSEENDEVRILRYSASNGWNARELDTEVSNGMATARTDQGGVFVASGSSPNYVLIGALVGSLLVVILIIGAVIIFFIVRRDKWQKVKSTVKNTKTNVTRSFASKV